MTRKLIGSLAIIALLAQAPLALASVAALANMPAAPAGGNYVDTRQYKVTDSIVPGTSIRQNVTAWKVNAGQWNGQNLDGLSLVLVEQFTSAGDDHKVVACYVSEYASPAQREALLTALQSSQPQLKETPNIRLEPANIRIELDGHVAIIHLGLIA